MRRRLLRLLVLATFLLYCCNLSYNTREAKAVEPIYIRPDGSIEPPDAPISTFDNTTYVLTSNVANPIIIERNNLLIEGDGFLLQGNDVGLNLTNVYNVTIKNFHIIGFQNGVVLKSSSACTIMQNHLNSNTRYAVWLDNSTNTNIRENNIQNNGVGVVLWRSSCNNSASGNHIATNKEYGIYIYQSSNYNSIQANSITTNAWDAIRLFNSSDNDISENELASNLAGVTLDYSAGNTVFGNNITENRANAICLAHSNNNTITNNNMKNNTRGLLFTSSSRNILNGNNITDNNLYGVSFLDSSHNRIFNNNFAQNFRQAYSTQSHNNSWDNGFLEGGNYWSDYNGEDTDKDGIGDTPHAVSPTTDPNVTDNFPLMGYSHSHGVLQTNQTYKITLISNSSIADFRVEEHLETSTIRFTVFGEDGFGFCRICIPKSLMTPPYTILIDDGQISVNYYNATVFDNSTHRWIYFTYPHSQHEVLIVNELSAFAVLAFLIMISCILLLVGRRASPTKFTFQPSLF